MMISCQSSHGQDVAQQQRERLFKTYMEVKKDIKDENFVGSKIDNPYAASMRHCGQLVKGMAKADYPEPLACH